MQDIFLTKTAEFADVVLPASASWCEAEGTVTNSERRVQRVAGGAEAAGRGARRRPHPHATSPPAWGIGGTTAAARTSGTSCARSPRTTRA